MHRTRRFILVKQGTRGFQRFPAMLMMDSFERKEGKADNRFSTDFSSFLRVRRDEAATHPTSELLVHSDAISLNSSPLNSVAYLQHREA